MIKQTHIDTSTLLLDQTLRERLASRCSPPDENGCILYQEGRIVWAAHIECLTRAGERVATSVLRVAFALAGLGHVAPGEEIAHTCAHTTCTTGLCVNPDHFDKQSLEQQRRAKSRRRHRAAFRKTFPNYQESRA